MERREVLKYTVLLTGAAISTPLLSSLLTACKSDTKAPDNYRQKFFNDQDFALVRDLIDTILPETDSPSATQVGVHKTIDTMVGQVYKAGEKEDYKTQFNSLSNYLREQNGFRSLSGSEKLDVLKTLESSKEDALKDTRSAYLNLKQQTIAYYLSTEEIGKNYLNYLPIPGKYKACISLEEVNGKAWAL